MRIISQDGRLDIPYKGFCFAVLKDGGIAVTKELVVDDNGCVDSMQIARYSNEGKAIEALRLLKEKYSILKTIEMLDLETIKGVFYDSEEVAELAKPYFQFPKDEEIELDEEKK